MFLFTRCPASGYMHRAMRLILDIPISAEKIEEVKQEVVDEGGPNALIDSLSEGAESFKEYSDGPVTLTLEAPELGIPMLVKSV